MHHLTSAIAVSVALGLVTTAAPAEATPTLVTLASFDGVDSGYPYAGLVGSGGALFGTTIVGGAFGDGAVFKLTGGGLTTIASFDGADSGRSPRSSLTVDAEGDLYGTTSAGGPSGGGTVFEIKPGGALTTVADLGSSGGDLPLGGLTVGPGGNLYGTTAFGGGGGGEVYQLSPAGVLTTLANFDYANGVAPSGHLVVDASGAIYGTTEGDATGFNFSTYPTDYGTVYKIAPGGGVTTLVQFNSTNGSTPTGGLIADAAGNLYGTTPYGGVLGDGTVFKVTPDGTLTTLAEFSPGAGGFDPEGSLVLDSHGNLYGTTLFGGTGGVGTVFRLSPGGVLTTIVNFNYYTGIGAEPMAGLITGAEGALFGTTAYGGADGAGTVFEVKNPASDIGSSSPVPEPATWGLVMVGMAFAGGSLRARRSRLA